MAAYDNVSLPGSPAAPSYAAPLLDFSPIAKLPQSYFQGTQEKRTMALQNAFKDGLPQNPDGTIDINSMTQTLAKLGGADAAMPLLNLSIGQQVGNSAGNFLQNPTGNNIPPTGIPNGGNLPAPGPRNTSGTGASADSDAPFTLTSMAIKAGIDPNSAQGRADIDTMSKRLNIDPDKSISDQGTKDTIARMAAAATSPGRNRTAQNGQVPGSSAPMQANKVQAQTLTADNALPGNYTEQQAQADQQAASAIRAQAARYAGAGRKDISDKMEKEADAREARAKQIYEALAKRGERTTEEKNAIASGERSPLTFEAQKAVQAANIKHSEALEGGIQSLGNSSATMLDNVRLQKSIVSNPEFYSGTANEAALFLKRAVPGLAGSAAPMELYQKVLNANMLHLIDNMKASSMEMGATTSRIFTAQINQIEKASGTLDNSQAGLRALAELNERALMRNVQIADYATAYKQGDYKNLPAEFTKGGPPKQQGILDANFERGLRDWMSKNPMLTQNELADPKNLGHVMQKGPAIGAEHGGFRFKGGNPKDQKNWIPITQEQRL